MHSGVRSPGRLADCLDALDSNCLLEAWGLVCTDKRPLPTVLGSFVTGPPGAAKAPPMVEPRVAGDEGAVRHMRVPLRLPPPRTAPVLLELPPWTWTVAQRELGRHCPNGPRI